MKILITGATGLVGGDLIAHCLGQGIDINFLTRQSEKLDSIEGASGFLWKPEMEEIDSSCFDGVDAIVNLAGAPIATRWTRSNKDKILNSRIQSLKALFKGLSQNNPGTVQSLISASAIGIYPHSLTNFYTEKESLHSEGFAGRVVRAWEEEVIKFKDLVPHVAIARIGLVLSDQGGALPKMAAPVKSFVGAAFGSGDQWQSWIHLDDLSSMILFLIENEQQGIFNAVAPNPVTQNKLIKELSRVLNRPLLLPNVPKFAMKLLLGEMSEILTASQRVSSKKIESIGFHFQYLNLSPALEAIYHKETESQ